MESKVVHQVKMNLLGTKEEQSAKAHAEDAQKKIEEINGLKSTVSYHKSLLADQTRRINELVAASSAAPKQQTKKLKKVCVSIQHYYACSNLKNTFVAAGCCRSRGRA